MNRIGVIGVLIFGLVLGVIMDRLLGASNDETSEVPEETTIAQLLEQLQLVSQHVAVEVNYQLVPRSEHKQHTLQDGDRLEIVTLVGGG